MSRTASDRLRTFGLASCFYYMTLAVAIFASYPYGGEAIAVFLAIYWLIHFIVFLYRLKSMTVDIAILIVITMNVVWYIVPSSGTDISPQANRESATEVAFALAAYRELQGRELPPIAYEHGEAHSWRVLLLPYIEHQQVFDRYDFSEAWNGPRNTRLLDAYGNPFPLDSTRNDAKSTKFEMVARRNSDGTYTPLFIVDAPYPVPWTKPSVLTPDEFLAAYTRVDSDVSWSIGHHRSGWLTDSGWTIHCIRVSDGRLFRCDDSIPAEVIQTLQGDGIIANHESLRLLPGQPWRWNLRRFRKTIASIAALILTFAPSAHRKLMRTMWPWMEYKGE